MVFDWNFITGFMLGFEIVETEELGTVCVIDCGFIRLTWSEK